MSIKILTRLTTTAITLTTKIDATALCGLLYSLKNSNIHPGLSYGCLNIAAEQFQCMGAGKLRKERKAVGEICSIRSICIVAKFLIQQGCVPDWSSPLPRRSTERRGHQIDG